MLGYYSIDKHVSEYTFFQFSVRVVINKTSSDIILAIYTWKIVVLTLKHKIKYNRCFNQIYFIDGLMF